MCPSPSSGLDAQEELRVEKLLSAIVQQQGIDAVAERKVHARRDEDVVPTVGVQIADARSPGPVVLHAHTVRNFLEFIGAEIVIERVAENKTALWPHQELFRLRFRRLLLFVRRADVRPHVRVHVGDEQVHTAVVVVVEKLHPHGAPRRFWEIPFGLLGELALVIFKKMVRPIMLRK